jgi:hypothetical protein
MFSRDELIQHAHSPGDDDDLPPIEVVEFREHQFTKPTCGHRIAAHRGDKEHFSSAMIFWLWSLQLTDRPGSARDFLRLAEASLCEPIDDRTYFQTIADFVAELKRPGPEFLRRRDSFVSGLRMFGGVGLGYHRTSVLAEFNGDFVALHSRIAL